MRDTLRLWWTAYADLLAMARQMWPTLLIIILGYVGVMIAWFTLPLLVGTGFGKIVMRFLILLGATALLAPYFVALHRFLALGEVRWLVWHHSYGRATAVYAAWAATTVSLIFAPIFLSEVAIMFSYKGRWVLASYLVTAILLVRLTTLLPMAALDPDRSGWQTALAQTKNRFWLCFAVTNVAALPAYLALSLLLQSVKVRGIEPVVGMLLLLAAILAMQLIPLSVATRIYERQNIGVPRRGPARVWP